VAENVRRVAIPQITQMNTTNNFIVWTIPNGVDLEKYKLTEDDDRAIFSDCIYPLKKQGKNIAYIGTITNKKGPMLMLQAFERLICDDEDWRLHVAGDVVDPRYEIYMNHIITEMGLNDFITFYGHQNNILQWLQKMHYVACSSPWESQNMSVMEAMATGCCPLVHNFPGAKEIYPEEYIWTTVNEFADLALSIPWEPETVRKVIEDRYNLIDTNNQIKEVFDEIEKGRLYGEPFQIRN
jgi:glycosyltransferase involved in cell wall biosynthesis